MYQLYKIQILYLRGKLFIVVFLENCLINNNSTLLIDTSIYRHIRLCNNLSDVRLVDNFINIIIRLSSRMDIISRSVIRRNHLIISEIRAFTSNRTNRNDVVIIISISILRCG